MKEAGLTTLWGLLIVAQDVLNDERPACIRRKPMPRARREANAVRREILEGIKEYAETRVRMMRAAATRRSEEQQRLAQAACGTVCADIPVEFIPFLRGWQGRKASAEPAHALSLN